MDDKDSEEKKEVRCFIAEDSDRFKGSPVPEERQEFHRRLAHMMELNDGKIFSDRTEIIIVVVMWILVFLFGC
jgi:hypothetical protein